MDDPVARAEERAPTLPGSIGIPCGFTQKLKVATIRNRRARAQRMVSVWLATSICAIIVGTSTRGRTRMTAYQRERLETQLRLEAMLAQYTALRQYISSSSQWFVSLASLALVAVASGLTISSQLELDPLKAIMPLTFVLLRAWAISQMHNAFYVGDYVAVMERRINRLTGAPILEWDSVWTFTVRRSHVAVGNDAQPGRVIGERDFGRSTFPILFVSGLMVLLVAAAFAWALFAGSSAVADILGTLSAWAVQTLVITYVVFHIVLAITCGAIWFFWVPRSLRNWRAVWEKQYGLVMDGPDSMRSPGSAQ